MECGPPAFRPRRHGLATAVAPVGHVAAQDVPARQFSRHPYLLVRHSTLGCGNQLGLLLGAKHVPLRHLEAWLVVARRHPHKQQRLALC